MQVEMIHSTGGWFKDDFNRTLLLRGVNLGGSSKVPAAPDGATYRKEGFYDHCGVSFVGRPFPLEEADEHFRRLKSWGLTFVRFLVTWEAVEHAGPGRYDQAYLDYLHAVLLKADRHGIQVFIDPHQDVWSRFSGGDGAPGWTLEMVGLDITALSETGAAITHQEYGDPLPRMIWPTNDSKLAAATMFTLFFAGNDFAPMTRIEGEPVQEFLQRHYIAAVQAVAGRLKGLPNVVGFDTMNEPSPGFVGCPDLNRPWGHLQLGPSPTPYQSMLLGSGIPQVVDTYELTLRGPQVRGRLTLNPDARRAWLPGRECIWQSHGVWESSSDGGRLLKPDYFARINEHVVDIHRDYFMPFARRYLQAIRQIEPRCMIFVEGIPRRSLPEWTGADGENIAAAPHWYDALVLLLKEFNPWLGYDPVQGKLALTPWGVRRSFAEQIRRLRVQASHRMNKAPLLIGEFGIAFDLHHKRAYTSGSFRDQVQALDRSMQAMDSALVSWTLWNYTADNTNARGDLWNDEDLSIFSRDQQIDPGDLNAGGRALEAVVRPYPIATAGEPLYLHFDVKRRTFVYRFRDEPTAGQPTEIFLPVLHYPHPPHVRISDGRFEIDMDAQVLRYFHRAQNRDHTIRISPLLP